MIRSDVIVVGAGPAGSAAAKSLKEAGRDVLLLDRQDFPRMKPCAGWIPPDVIQSLQFDSRDYSGSFTENVHFRVSFFGVPVSFKNPQYSIRRIEFDDYLLKRSGVELVKHRVEEIRKEGNEYIIDGAYACNYLIGAGGTSCPVNRILFSEKSPRDRKKQLVALEEEIACPPVDSVTRLRFFDDRLPGYSWLVPKENGYINMGLGAVSVRLSKTGTKIKDHWDRLVHRFSRDGLVPGREWNPLGHTYYLLDKRRTPRIDNAFLIGDSLGVATLDLAEGIGPSIETGHLAARSIISGSDYNPYSIRPYSSFPPLGRSLAGFLSGFMIG